MNHLQNDHAKYTEKLKKTKAHLSECVNDFMKAKSMYDKVDGGGTRAARSGDMANGLKIILEGGSRNQWNRTIVQESPGPGSKNK
jgi:hypothetical protein